jgi:MiaB-like tRNA modifying enzyme
MPKVFIKTFGCSLNQADSETMAGVLIRNGHQIVDDEESADVLIVNSCTVKDATETRFFNYVSKLPKKPMIIAGCIAQTAPEKLQGYSLLGVEQLDMIHEVLEETINGHTVTLIARNENPRLDMPRVRKNPIVEIIPICRGCLGNCAYCKARVARGGLLSYDPDLIVARAREALEQGVREIWLTAQDTGAYGLDFKQKGRDIVYLLERICAIDGNFLVRLGMANPNHIKKLKDRLIEVFKHKHMFKFLHIPVQSGSDRILTRMNRRYTREEFKSIIDGFRKSLPRLTISTDMICGFPGETQDQFKESLDLISEIKPDVLNISRFSRKEGTPAADFEDQLKGSEIKERSRAMTRIFAHIAYENNFSWINWTGNIIIDEKGKDNTWIGRNYAYKQVIVEGDFRIGDIVPVKIHARGRFDLRARHLQ